MLPLSDDIERRRFPFLTLILISICALVFLYELSLDEIDFVLFFYKYGLLPSELTTGVDYQFLQTPFGPLDISTGFPNWLTLFTSMFIHGDWMHFLSNMLYLWVFGRSVEDRFGPLAFIAFYLVSGVAAGWMQIAASSDPDIPVIGASGAIAGVLGAYFFMFPFSRIRTLAIIVVFITFVRVPAIILLGFWLYLQFVGGLGSLGPEGIGGVAYWAHIGGFVCGAIVGFLWLLLRRQSQRLPTSAR